ncbi:hypothetical protein EJ05DRAFT_501180 [Pseudovirgaria hyperparasitica]|uniref:Uncharacterized protein n=1 Tax=Pseudovirgaria hyperparasitica TaxID=470096 RepID=A0A6A6W4Y4_9PEZI|nr:uncharacterized protein EJ05DRAFT_501180 [Pseudovirgaria hyperparasitica]KAF2757653.1 hypothetical protein EJ05DRAFT_501180 [Pseudovirgaria hyperparasitica]
MSSIRPFFYVPYSIFVYNISVLYLTLSCTSDANRSFVSRHDAIRKGVGTAITDNPSLNCRLHGVGGYEGEGLTGQPQPIILDAHCKWKLGNGNANALKLASTGQGKSRWILYVQEPIEDDQNALEKVGG